MRGKGSENNQPLIQQFNNDDVDFSAHKKDTLPNNVIQALKIRNEHDKKLLQNYISTYLPSKEFIRTHDLMVQYSPLIEYIQFKGNHKFVIRKAFTRNEQQLAGSGGLAYHRASY